ncbi:MAG TPA: tetratricopeptide repeat protein [Terriglobales bacterium]
MSPKTRSRSARREAAREAARTEPRQEIHDGVIAWAAQRNWVICLLLAVGTFALYSPVLGHPFIFNYDDDGYVLENQHVQAGLTWATIKWAITSTEYSNWHPVTWLSHALDCQLYGLNPWGHHFTSVLVHVLNVVLLFLLLQRATGATGRSFVVAALFAVHPLNVESVAWIAEHKSVLCTLFFFLSIGAYGWYARKPGVGRYLLIVVLFALALAAKPMAITLPFALLLLDYWPLGRIQGWGEPSEDEQGPQRSFLWLIAEKLPLLVLCAGSAWVTVYASQQYGSMRLKLPLGARIGNAICAYAMYLWKGVWPAKLAVFYPHPGMGLAGWKIGLAALFLMAITAMVWIRRKAQPYLATGWLWYLGIMVPAVGIVQVGEQGMADRYAYIPLIGIFVMCVWGFADWAESGELTPKSRAWAAAIVILFFTAFTGDQIRYWKSAADLWQHAVNVTKDNFTADQNLGAAMIMSDRAAEAIPALQDGVRLRPQDASAHLNLAGAYALSGHRQEAIQQYETAIPLTTDRQRLAGPYDTLGRLYEQTGNYQKAIVSYAQSLSIDPSRASARERLAHAELSAAIREVAEKPSGSAYLRLGLLMQRQGRTDDARSAYQQALKLDPGLTGAKQALDSLK